MSRRPSGKPFARYKHVTRMCRFVYPHRRQSNLADGRLSARPGIADAGWGRDLRKWYREKSPQLLRKRVIVTGTGHSPDGRWSMGDRCAAERGDACVHATCDVLFRNRVSCECGKQVTGPDEPPRRAYRRATSRGQPSHD